MKVVEAFNSGLIPMDYMDIVPSKCKCGSDLEVSDTLTRLWCPSNKCTWKQIARMNKMLTVFGVRDVGEAYCADLWREMEYYGIDNSHVNIFTLPFSKYPSTFSIEVSFKRFRNIQSVVMKNNFGSGMYLGELVSKLSLPELDMNARKLFAGFNSVKEFHKNAMYKYHGVYNYVRYIFGDGVQSKKIYNILKEFYSDIQIAERLFKVKKSVDSEIRVSITGRVNKAGRFTRDAYLRYCNDLCDGVAEILDVNPGPTIACVIADEPSNSSTYIYGVNHNNIVSSDKFVEWLKREVI